MNVIYFPGYGGGQKSTTWLTILARFPGSKIIIYDNLDAVKAANEIAVQLRKNTYLKPLNVGQSLGGFWAEHVAVKYSFDVLLINPSLAPWGSMKKYGVTDSILKQFKTFQTARKTSGNISIILSKEDDIVDPSPV